MRLTFTNSHEDNALFARYHFDRSPEIQKSIRLRRWGTAFLFLLLAGYGYATGSTPLVYWGVGMTAVFVLLYRLFYRFIFLRQVGKAYGSSAQRKSPMKITISLGNDEMTIEDDYGTGTVSYREIEHIDNIGDHTFVYLDRAQALIVPRSAVIEGDYARFVADLELKFFEYRSTD